jgi:hypothetical protein
MTGEKIRRKEDFYDTKTPTPVGLREEIKREDIRDREESLVSKRTSKTMNAIRRKCRNGIS